MNVDQIKALILNTRKQLSVKYSLLGSYKRLKSSADEAGEIETEYYFHNLIQELKPEIAKLVDLQKALKADLRKDLSYARSVRRMSLVVMGK